ncbi:hypothetical protein [Leifsonia virtsii]|uniref:Uncharacterized protein n=1 Tax=Leifsonia virtsii TaxID=3035915 RepID=A0ABT8ISY1_9MICO|nr:hypothetical protein [Leifsonia virtsii]MDN4595909.1 hypothetical protein [Leifsonia virtsii]
MTATVTSGWSGDRPDVVLIIEDDNGTERSAVQHLTPAEVVTLANDLLDVGMTALKFGIAIRDLPGGAD